MYHIKYNIVDLPADHCMHLILSSSAYVHEHKVLVLDTGLCISKSGQAT